MEKNANIFKYLTICFITICVMFLIGAGFYWYEYRPSQIRKECTKTAETVAQDSLKSKIEMAPSYQKEELENAASKGMYMKDDYNSAYQNCLAGKGLVE